MMNSKDISNRSFAHFPAVSLITRDSGNLNFRNGAHLTTIYSSFLQENKRASFITNGSRIGGIGLPNLGIDVIVLQEQKFDVAKMHAQLESICLSMLASRHLEAMGQLVSLSEDFGVPLSGLYSLGRALSIFRLVAASQEESLRNDSPTNQGAGLTADISLCLHQGEWIQTRVDQYILGVMFPKIFPDLFNVS